MAAVAVGKAAGAAYGHGESSGGSGGFLGPRVPAEVEAMARGLQEVGKETFRRLLKGTAQCGSPALRASDAGKGVPFGGRHRREPRGWREAVLCPPLRRAAVLGRAPMSSPAFRCHVFHSSLYSTRIAYSSGCRPSSSSLGCSPGRGQRSCTEAAGPRKVVVVCQRGHDPRGKVFVTALRL